MKIKVIVCVLYLIFIARDVAIVVSEKINICVLYPKLIQPIQERDVIHITMTPASVAITTPVCCVDTHMIFLEPLSQTFSR